MTQERPSIKPSDLNAGFSWGLEYPFIYGRYPGHCAWAVWNRHTGEITHWFPDELNQHGYNFAPDKARAASLPKGYYMNPAEQDMVA